MANHLTPSKTKDLLQQIRQNFPNDPWQELLEIFTITGVAANDQIASVIAYERIKQRRFLERIEKQSNDLPPILYQFPKALQRPGVKGRPASIYMLGESGAALLRQLGQHDVQACGLKDETTITHALGMVDLHLAAQRAGIQVVTDRTVPYSEDQVLRPDHQISLSGRKTLIFEIEQSASSETLRRVQSSIERKRSFFESQESTGFERSVYILFQIAGKIAWNKTITTWSRAVQINEQNAATPLNFKLRAMSLADFIANPDWHASQEQPWFDLSAPEPQASLVNPTKNPPAELLEQSAYEDRLVIAALWQDFIENAEKHLHPHPLPDPEFLRTMRLIYTASHDPDLPPLAQAARPYASIYLLNHYLAMRGLNPRLQVAINRGRQTLRWNPTTILHRMQTVIDIFLGLHGWRSDGPLIANPVLPEWNAKESPASFQVNVKIRDPQILIPQDESVMPTNDEIANTQQALAWVLRALFAYSSELDLNSPEFW